jgi:hypothetical protein
MEENDNRIPVELSGDGVPVVADDLFEDMMGDSDSDEDMD